MPGPWDKYGGGGAAPAAAPSADPIIKPVDQFRVRDQQLQEEAAARAEAQFNATQAREDRRDQRAEVKDAQGTESERTAGYLTQRIVNSTKQLAGVAQRDPGAQLPSLGTEMVRGVVGDNAANYVTDADRQQIRAAELDVLDAALTLGTGAAYTREQLEGYRTSYFPQLGDDPTTVKSKRERLIGLLDAARLKAGKAAPDIEQAIAALQAIDAVAAQGTGGQENLPGSQPGDLQVTVTDETPEPPNPEALRLQQEYQKRFGDNPAGIDGVLTLAKHGVTGGLSDEAAGIGGALSGLLTGDLRLAQNYRNSRDAEMLNVEAARQFHPRVGLPAELLGAGAGMGTNALATGVGAFKQGALGAGVAGFGYGRGFENSTSNALISAAAGGTIAKGLQLGGNALLARQGAAANTGERVAGLARAGEAEGVTVNRAMADPSLANKVSRADASIAGGRKIQREMSSIEGQVETRVGELGRGGQAMDNVALGDRVKSAGERFIEKSGKAAKAKYDRAEQIAGNTKVTPKESLSRADEMIKSLSETPGTNKAEIAFLKEIKADLGKDLSVSALRRMRTKLRKQISKGELTFGEDEARVLSIMDAAADDIRAGLTAAGKGKAARAFDVADKAYRARMDYINGTVQKLLGKRNSSLPAEQIARKFSSMASSDARGLRKFYATLDPDEAADVAATFAERVGKNNKGEFSVAHFLSQTEKMSDEAIRTVFGHEGANSVRNLRALGKEVNRVTSAMNSRTSKSGVAAGNYRDWLFNLLLGGGSAGAAGLASGGGEALAAGASVVAIKTIKDAFSARALMSPNLSKWIRNAPNTASPKAIDAHFARLTDIAKAEPALANEIDLLRSAMMQAANDNPTVARSVAKDEDSRKR